MGRVREDLNVPSGKRKCPGKIGEERAASAEAQAAGLRCGLGNSCRFLDASWVGAGARVSPGK